VVVEPQTLPWHDPGWLDRVASWVAIALERVDIQPRGKLKLVRTRPWAAIARITTTAGDLWFKEPAPSLAFEPALTAAVSRRCPDFTAEVLAAEGTWLLTRDAGRQLRAVIKDGDPAPSWDELLPRYAELQTAFLNDEEKLISLGTPDKRPRALAAAYPALVERVGGLDGSRVEELHALGPALDSLVESGAGPLPVTLIHEEFHEGSVFVREARARLLDWGEAALSHPFAGIVNTFRDIAFRRRLRPNGREMLRLRAVYLEPWSAFASPGELNELFDRGYVLGALCRALTWDRVLAGQSAEVRAEYARNAAVWLNLIFREALEEGVRLGA
jgi:hypothetical protein